MLLSNLGMALVLLAVVSSTDVRVGVEVTTVVAIPGPATEAGMSEM